MTSAEQASERPVTTQADLYALAEQNLPGAGLGGYSLPESVRFIVARGVGSRLQSVEGRWYIDYVNGTLHGNPLAAAAGLATIRVLEEPGFYDKLHEKSRRLASALQEVLDRHGLSAIAAGRRSFWQILFMTGEPHNQTDIMASDQVRMRELDLELLRRGIYVLPGVRRFVCAVNTDEDFDDTVGALDAACKAIN